MNAKAAAVIGVIALVVIVAAVAVALGSGDDGGEDDYPDVYHHSIQKVSRSSTIGYIATVAFEEHVEPGTTITLFYEGQELNSIVLQGSGQHTPGVGSKVGIHFMSDYGHTMEELESLLEVQVENFETIRV